MSFDSALQRSRPDTLSCKRLGISFSRGILYDACELNISKATVHRKKKSGEWTWLKNSNSFKFIHFKSKFIRFIISFHLQMFPLCQVIAHFPLKTPQSEKNDLFVKRNRAQVANFVIGSVIKQLRCVKQFYSTQQNSFTESVRIFVFSGEVNIEVPVLCKKNWRTSWRSHFCYLR